MVEAVLEMIKTFGHSTFFITDQVNQLNMEIQYCPTDLMTADYITKPSHGKKFIKFKKETVNFHI